MEVLQTIAMLCSIHIGAMGVTIEKIREEQINCHKYYVECLGPLDSKEASLKRCIKERK